MKTDQIIKEFANFESERIIVFNNILRINKNFNEDYNTFFNDIDEQTRALGHIDKELERLNDLLREEITKQAKKLK